MSATDAPVAPPEVQQPPVVATNTVQQPQQPRMYAVILLNDESTAPQFVVELLGEVFSLNRQDANRVMLTAHRQGQCLVKSYTKEVAETKVAQAHDIVASRGVNALRPGAPCELRFTVEPLEVGSNG